MLVAQGVDLGPVKCRMIVLVDFIGREIRHVDVGSEAWFEGCADGAELVPYYAMEERMLFDVHASKLTTSCA